MGMFGSNPNKDFKARATLEGGSKGGNKVDPGAIGGLNIYKTKRGQRAVSTGSVTYYETDPGSGKFHSSTGGSDGGWINVSDYDPNPTPAPAPKAAPSSSGGSGGSSSSSSRYTTSPTPGNTGNAQFNAQTTALQAQISALVEAISNQQKAKIEDVSEPAPGIDSTILTPSLYDPSKEKKKKSYLTPIAVG